MFLEKEKIKNIIEKELKRLLGSKRNLIIQVERVIEKDGNVGQYCVMLLDPSNTVEAHLVIVDEEDIHDNTEQELLNCLDAVEALVVEVLDEMNLDDCLIDVKNNLVDVA